MDREKVLRGLEICKENLLSKETCKITGCPYADIPEGTLDYKSCRTKMIADALSLLKAQEPEKPIYKQVVNEYEKYTEYINRTFCATCGAEFINRVNYCPFCGKAVKWDD